MSTIQQEERNWASQDFILEPGERMMFAVVAGFALMAAIVLGIVSNFTTEWYGICVLGSIIALIVTAICAYMAVTDLIRHNHLLRDEYVASLHREELSRAELNTANVEIGYLRDMLEPEQYDSPH